MIKCDFCDNWFSNDLDLGIHLDVFGSVDHDLVVDYVVNRDVVRRGVKSSYERRGGYIDDYGVWVGGYWIRVDDVFTLVGDYY